MRPWRYDDAVCACVYVWSADGLGVSQPDKADRCRHCFVDVYQVAPRHLRVARYEGRLIAHQSVRFYRSRSPCAHAGAAPVQPRSLSDLQLQQWCVTWWGTDKRSKVSVENRFRPACEVSGRIPADPVTITLSADRPVTGDPGSVRARFSARDIR